MKRFSIIGFVLVAIMLVTGAQAAQVTDMYGRTVTLPAHVGRVMGASPTVTYMIYTIDPALLVGLNLPLDEGVRKFFRPETVKLPVVGGFGGQGRNFNPEMLLTLNPDLVVSWPPRSGAMNPRAEQMLNSARIPYICIRLDNMSDYPAAYEFLGEILGRRERGKTLAAYFRAELKKLDAFSAKIPENRRVSVYFAEEANGLTTVSSKSVHGEAVALAGGRNVHPGGPAAGNRAKDRVSMEQVLTYNPDVIVAQDESFYKRIYTDTRWAGLSAVRNKRVYLIPDAPFDWMDRPPTFLRLMGAKWLAGVLYPRSAGTDMLSETREFFRLFFGVSLSDADVRAVLNE
jgi:iron complex transport system substrate-binding protein